MQLWGLEIPVDKRRERQRESAIKTERTTKEKVLMPSNTDLLMRREEEKTFNQELKKKKPWPMAT